MLSSSHVHKSIGKVSSFSLGISKYTFSRLLSSEMSMLGNEASYGISFVDITNELSVKL